MIAILMTSSPNRLRPFNGDLVVSDGGRLNRLEKKISIWDFAWHPDGELIGCATDGRFIFHDLRKETTKVVDFKDTDPRLSAHGLFDCRWSAEHQGFVGRLRFLGGVLEGFRVFGDDELFVVAIEGKARFLNSVDKYQDG